MDEMQDVIPSLIENTTMQLRVVDGTPRSYWITPISGYVLHDKESDFLGTDPVTGEDVTLPGFTRGTCSCGANYDFTTNPREFYAIPASEVSEDQIFGGVTTPDHEVM